MSTADGDEPNTWPELIGQLILLKDELTALDSEAGESNLPPHLGASEDALQAAEAELGEPFDAVHREFLRHADGWPSFDLSMDLLGTADFIDRAQQAELTEALALTLPEPYAIDPDDLYILAAAREDRDLIVIGRRGTTIAGQVIWLAGDEIERYSGFRDWFLGTIALHQNELTRLLQ